MSYHVRMKIFSGMPDPEWTLDAAESRSLTEQLAALPEMIRPAQEDAGGLGYRGYVITRLMEEEEGSPEALLPQSFSIPAGVGLGTEGFLLRSSERSGSGVDDTLREHASSASAAAAAASKAVPQVGSGQSCAVSYLTSNSNFAFWNDSAYILNNNCYAFGSNYRSNTFPQPGRRARVSYDNKTVNGLTAALYADGWRDGCLYSPARNISVAAVIWPGYDFHFYRRCAGGMWCHKPGMSAARNVDGSGQTIWNPQYCNRGGYTQFVGYVYADSFVAVA